MPVCLNCDKEFEESDNYCRRCGQETSTHRLTTKHAFHHFLHAFTHTDRGFFALIPQLLVKPGIVAREYNEGKRKTYFNPFTFMLVIVAISTLLVAYNNFMSIPNGRYTHPVARMITDFISKHFNIVVLIGIPATAYFTSILFKNRINFAESLVLACYTSGERSIFFILIVIPLVLLFKAQYFLITYSYIMLFMFYYGWSCMQCLRDRSVKTFLKGLFAIVLTQIFITVLIAIVITVAIFFSKMQDKISG